MRTLVTSTRAGRFVVLLIAGLLWTSILTAQSVTLSVTGAPIQKVCKEIEKQTGYYFVYPKDLAAKTGPVTLQLNKAPLQQALETLFKGRPFTWSITDKVISINTMKPAERKNDIMVQDTVQVSGRVLNKAGEPLTNATVASLLTKKVTATDEAGQFKLRGLRMNEELQVSYTGYKSVTQKLIARRSIVIVLELADNDLDKVVVQAYGTTSRRLATGNIGVLTGEEIAKQPVTNMLDALQGRIAGLDVMNLGARGNGAFKVEIRGRNSVDPSFASEPLYIIDGVPLTILDVGGTGDASGVSGSNYSKGIDQSGITTGQSPLYSINPADIESIEVLKDADATAIYGSRGANGVILINTKKGKPGKSIANLAVTQGVNFATNFWPVLGTKDYLAMRRESFRNDNIIPTAGNALELVVWDSTRYTDWTKYTYGGLGKWTNLQAEFTGGSTQTSYRLAAGYTRTTGISNYSGSNQRFNFSSSLNGRSSNQKFSWILNTLYSFSTDDDINKAGDSKIYPNAPAIFDSAGALNWFGWNGITAFESLTDIYNEAYGRTKALNSGLELRYTLLKGLVAKINLGYNSMDANRSSFTTIRSQNPSKKPTGSARYGITNTNNWNVEPQMEYNGFWGGGRLNALLGATVQSNKTTTLRVTGQGYTNDALLKSLTYAATLFNANKEGSYKYAGTFARLVYNYQNKYIVSLNGRRDGSSRFGPGNRFGNFGSIGATWNASDEAWWQKVMPAIISLVKFRSSYGITGSDAVGDYKYLSQWGNSSQDVAPYNGVAVLLPQILENENFHWEVNKKAEIAITLGFLKDRFTVDAAWYRNRCNNQLVNFPIPTYTGFNTVTANSAANVQNSGWEFGLSAKIIDRKDLRWNIAGNLSFNKNKLISYPDFEHSPFYSLYRIGESLDKLYVYKYTGIDPLTGQRTYEDHNHDGVIKANDALPPGTGDDDKYYAVSRSPKYFGSINNQVSYKGFQVSLVFGYKKYIRLGAVSYQSGAYNLDTWSYEQRWKYAGDTEAKYPRLTTAVNISDYNFNSSSGHYEDASFIRLRTVAIAYALPDKMVKKAGLNSLNITVNAQNIFVLTRYNGIDPENGSVGQPAFRTATAGITCSF